MKTALLPTPNSELRTRGASPPRWTLPFPPDIRPTILREVYLSRCTPSRYAELADFHYRGHQLPSGITHVFGAFLRGGIKGTGSRFATNSQIGMSQPIAPQDDPTRQKRVLDPFCRELGAGRLVGIVLYGLCPVRHYMRTKVFGKRFQLGGMRQGIQRLNREIRTIRRVVIDPQFRSIGLAWRMVHHTLPVVGVRYVDASAAMGSVNPFFTKAGMRHYPPSPTPANERILAAFRATGFDTEMITSVPRLERHMASLDAKVGDWLLGEVRKFNLRFQQIGRPPESWSLNRALQRIASTAATLPDYFVWERKQRRDCHRCPPVDTGGCPSSGTGTGTHVHVGTREPVPLETDGEEAK